MKRLARFQGKSMAKLKGTIIGFGNIAANGHWPAYAESQDIDIVAIVDPSVERQKLAEKMKPGVKTFSFFEEFLQAKGLAVDFVDICTPPTAHVKMAKECVRRG